MAFKIAEAYKNRQMILDLCFAAFYVSKNPESQFVYMLLSLINLNCLCTCLCHFFWLPYPSYFRVCSMHIISQCNGSNVFHQCVNLKPRHSEIFGKSVIETELSHSI